MKRVVIAGLTRNPCLLRVIEELPPGSSFFARSNYTADSMKLLPVLLSLALAAAVAQAQTSPTPAKPAAPPPARQLPLAHGEVLEVDRQAASVLVKHGPIPSLGMDPMTMEFLVPDTRLLALLKPGDKIRFAAAWKKGDYVITRVEVQKPGAVQRPKSSPPGK